jgi:hypothetical protein
LHLTDIASPGDVWDRAKQIFTEPIDRIKGFVVSLVDGVIQFVKDAVIHPLADLASKTRAWDLLIALLGKNPITGDPVPQTAETLIGGFMKLAGQDEVWENIKKSNAIARAFAWFKGAMAALLAFAQQIPTLFLSALKSFKITDLLDLPGTIARVVGLFGDFAGKFVSWALDAALKLAEIVFDAVSPGAWGYVQRTGAALKSILKNPMPFVGNLVQAAKLGLQNFAGNIGTHLKTGLIDWLTGSLPGVYIPKAFSLIEVGKFALSVLGVSWAQIRGKIVKALGAGGEKIMAGLETAFDVVVALVKGGPAAAWEVIKDKLGNLKDMVIEGITSFVVDTIVKKAIPKLVAMFIPGAGFVSAIISIYGTIMAFMERLSKIVAAVTAFIDSIVAIAAGQIAGAAAKVESALAGVLSLAIGLLAGFLGLGGIAAKVMAVVEKVRGIVVKALDTAIAWIVGKAKALFGWLFGGGDKKDGAKAGGAGVNWWTTTAPFADKKGQSHRVFFKGECASATLMVASAEEPTDSFIGRVEAVLAADPTARALGAAALAQAKSAKPKIANAQQTLVRLAKAQPFELIQPQKALAAAQGELASAMHVLMDLLPENQNTKLPVVVGQFVSIPYKGTTRKGEILVISDFRVRYRVDAVAANLEMPVQDFQTKWGQEIFQYVEGSLREEYLGATPGKASATGRAVIARYQDAHPTKIRTSAAGVVEVEWSSGKWHPLLDCDMSHSPVDAVDFWNATGRGTGRKSDTVRTWMLNSANYILEPASINRSRGSANNSRYQPPTV